MKKTVIIYGTSTGTCEDLAGRIGAKLGVDNIINVTDMDHTRSWLSTTMFSTFCTPNYVEYTP